MVSQYFNLTYIGIYQILQKSITCSTVANRCQILAHDSDNRDGRRGLQIQVR